MVINFVQFSEVPIDSMPHLQVNRLSSINFESWIRLVCCVYLDKHKTLYNSEQIATLHASLMNNPLPDDKVQLLKWLAYKQFLPFTSTAKAWFTIRRWAQRCVTLRCVASSVVL